MTAPDAQAAERRGTGDGEVMAEKPARCKCLHTQRSHAFRRTPRNSRRVAIKRLGQCLMAGCTCQQFVRPLADSLAASEQRQPVGVAAGERRARP